MKKSDENKNKIRAEKSMKTSQGLLLRNGKEKTHVIKSFFEIPREVISKEPKLTIMGFTEVLIENYKGILEYEDFYIRINTEIGIVNINGFNLELIQMTENDVIVTGKIQSISMEENTESAV